MTAEAYRQFNIQLEKSTRILVALPPSVDIDGYCAAVALTLWLQKQGKQVIVASSGSIPANLEFLPQLEIVSRLDSGNCLVVELDTTKRELGELSYQTKHNNVTIYLKAKSGQFEPADVKVFHQVSSFDLLIILNVSALESLGSLYQNHAELFFQTPKINLGTKAGNEYFGSTNLVDVTATSLSELMSDLICSRQNDVVVDRMIATVLLTGIIYETSSFQTAHTTPKALTQAADLMALGADHQEIVKHLFKTKDFSFLKLWGRTLARIHTESRHRLLYSTLLRDDFAKTGGDQNLLTQIVRELLENVSGFETVALLVETADQNSALHIATLPHHPPETLVAELGYPIKNSEPLFGPYRLTLFDLPISLLEAEQRLLTAAAKI